QRFSESEPPGPCCGETVWQTSHCDLRCAPIARVWPSLHQHSAASGTDGREYIYGASVRSAPPNEPLCVAVGICQRGLLGFSQTSVPASSPAVASAAVFVGAAVQFKSAREDTRRYTA